jgi:hypothetical protein
VFRSGGRIEGLKLNIPPWADTVLAATAILIILGLMALLACRRVEDDSYERTTET